MTDRETLSRYRLEQAEETLADARMMLAGGASARSVVNRSYYAMFYGVLALLLSMKWLFLAPAAWGVMAQLSKRDDRVFRIVGLWIRTKLLNRLRLAVHGCRGEFWRASSYGTTGRSRRAWDCRSAW